MFGLFDHGERGVDNAGSVKPSPLIPEDILHALGHKVCNGRYNDINMYPDVIGRDEEKLQELLAVKPDEIEDAGRRTYVQIGLSCLLANREGWRAGHRDGWISAAS